MAQSCLKTELKTEKTVKLQQMTFLRFLHSLIKFWTFLTFIFYRELPKPFFFLGLFTKQKRLSFFILLLLRFFVPEIAEGVK